MGNTKSNADRKGSAIRFRLTNKQKRLISRAAKKDERNVSDWIRIVLTREAYKVIQDG